MKKLLLCITIILCVCTYGWTAGVPFTGSIDAEDVDYPNTKSISGDPTNAKTAIDGLKTEIDNISAGTLTDIDLLPGDTVDDDKIDSSLINNATSTGLGVASFPNTTFTVSTAGAVSIKANVFQPDDADLDSLSSGITGPVLGLGNGNGYQALQLASELALTGTTLGLNTTLDLSGYTITFGLEASDIPDLSATYQAADTELAAIAALANGSGVLTNDGAGNMSWGAGGGSVTTSSPIGATAFTDLTAGDTYTNYGDADDDTINELFAAIDASWPSGSGAPTNASYLTAGSNETLSDERVVSADGLSLVQAADFATMRDSMGVQASNTSLTNIAANWTVDSSGNVSGMGTIEPTPTEHPQAVLYDSNAPGSTTAEKAMAYLWGEYVDGADDAENSSAGIAARAAGSWFDWIWYDKTVDQVKVARDLDVDGDVIAKSLTITKVSGVPSSTLRYEADGTSTLGIGELGPADISETWYAQDSNDQPNNSIPVYGQPTGTSGPGGTKISAKTWKSAPTGDIVGTSDTQTLTNKTLDANGTGNTVKGYGYLVFTKPSSFGGGVTQQTTATARTYGQALFADDTDSASNFIEYEGVVPYDLDANVEWEAFFKFILGGADTGDHDYVIGMASIADSEANSASIANTTGLTFSADASGAQGDVETASGTLTGWAEAVSAGEKIIIRVARDGDDAANDSSTVDSYSDKLVIRYGFSQ